MQIVKTIINQYNKLIGFEVEGQAWEFGNIGKDKVVTKTNLDALRERGFKNSQIEINTKSIIEKGSFKLKNLPMLMYNGKEFVEVDNTIKLLRRVLVDGSLAGFDCLIGGRSMRLISSNIIALSGWFRTENFVIRYKDKTRYIAGTAGHSIENLPVEELSKGTTTTGKKSTRTVTAGIGKQHAAQNISPFDMINLSEILKGIDGKFIYLPGTNYNRTLAPMAELDKSFKKTGVEVCGPMLDFSEKTLNVSIPFKQIGQLIVEVGGYDKTYYPFAYKKKTIFEAGRLNSPHLGIAIKKSDIATLQSRFGESLSLSLIADPMTNMYVKTFLQVRNPDDFVLLALNTENLSAMSLENAQRYVLKEEHLFKLEKELIFNKVITSYLRGVIKNVEEAAINQDGKSPRPLYGPFSILSEIELESIQNAGINVFTGAFEKKEEETEAKAAATATATSAIKAAQDVYADFGVAGYKTLPTYSTISKGAVKVESYAREMESIKNMQTKFDSFKTVSDIYRVAKSQLDLVTDEKDKLIHRLWLSNMASLTLGNFSGFKVANKNMWEAGKSLKGGTAYTYTGEDAPGLTLNLYGLNLV